MTLPQYLDTLAFGEEPDLRSVVWARDIVTRQQLAQAGADPYVVLILLALRPRTRMNQGQIFDQDIELAIFQEPTATGRVPSAVLAQQLWNALLAAPEHVDEGMYGRNLIELKHNGGFSPSYGERSSGLVAAVRFRERFGIGINTPNGG